MTQWLKVSTAHTFRLGPFVDSTDGVTAETALTLAQADFRLSKAGGAFASKNETTSGAHDENGYYTCILNTTDTNTLGPLLVNVSEAGALPVWRTFQVVPAQVWDSFFGADVLQVHAIEIAAALITATSIASDAITDAKVASDVTIASVTGAVGSVTGAVGSVTGAVGSVTGAVGSVTGNVGGNVTGSVGSVASGGIVAASFAADAITAAKVAADVGTEIGTAVWATTTRLLTAGTNIALAKGTGVTGFNDLDAAGVRTAVGLATANLDTQIGDLPTNAELATSQGTADDATLAAIAALNNPSAAGIADAVWDEDATGHQTQGTFGQAIGDPVADADTIWGLVNTNLNATVSSRASQTSVDDVPTNAELATALGTADDAVLAQVALVKAKTDALPTDPADQSLIIAATDALATLIGDVPTNAELATALGTADDATLAAIAALNNVSTAQVQTSAAAALTAYDPPTHAELTSGLAAADDAVLAQIALVKGVTDKVDDTLEDDAGTYRFTTNALEQAPTGGSAPTAAEIADAVWEEDLTDHSGTVGSVAEALGAAGAAGDPWSTALPGAYGAGSAGKIIGDNINATVSSRATPAQVNAEVDTAIADAALATAASLATVLADTNELQSDWTNGGRLDLILDARASQGSVDDLPTNAELATSQAAADDATLAAIAALNNVSTAQVQTSAATALAAYDPPTRTEATADKDAVLAAVAGVPTNAELATALGTSDDAVLAQVALVKSKTDSLTFTVAGAVDANIAFVNATEVTGDGLTGTEWGPAP